MCYAGARNMPASTTAQHLTAELRARHQEAQATWPSFAVPASYFIDRVLRLLPDPAQPEAALRALQASDFYLACGCVLGLPKALVELDRVIVDARGSLVRVLGHTGHVDDAEQLLRRKLMTAMNGPARIAAYSGRGTLSSWMRAVAARVALDVRRSLDSHESLDESDSGRLGVVLATPEMALISRRDRPRFEAAFARALRSLAPRERHALKLQVVDGLTVEAIAQSYGVNKSTVSRWLTQARQDVLARLRRDLEKETRLSGGELQSFMGLFQSRLDLSISQFLTSGG